MAKSLFSIKRLYHITAISITALIFFSPVKVHCDEEYRAWTGEFMRIGAGARAMGMGNAYTAVEGDIYSCYFNPAGLASMRQSQFALSFRYLSMDRMFKYLVFGRPIGPDADFAVSWISAGTEDIMGRDLNGNPTTSLRDNRNAFTLTFSRNVTEWISIGLNAKMAFWKLADEDAKAVGFDLGVILRPYNRLTAAFVVRDLNSRFTWQSKRWKKYISDKDGGQSLEKEDKFPLYYTGGLSYKLFSDKLLLSSTLEFVEDNPVGLDLGISYACIDRLTIRTGVYNYTSSDKLNSGSFTAGFTLKVSGSLQFDYAYASDGIEQDNLHVVSLLMHYGE
ncbi:PorV/PorQ family protein [Candidatus Latescibacterota bacterium]